MEEKWEYICDTDTESNIQKKLNQWRHEYTINIINMSTSISNDGYLKVTILLMRLKR